MKTCFTVPLFRKTFGLLLATHLFASALPAANNGLANAPYLGWSSWSKLRENVSEAKIKAQADSLSNNLKSVGYVYINLDDGWAKGTDGNGRWKADTAKFPNGIASLASYLHSKGLKFGIYLTPGVQLVAYNANLPIAGTNYHLKDIVSDASLQGNTRVGTAKKIDFTRPGAVQFVEGYASLLASWGVDAIKLDFVGPGGGSTSADTREDVAQWMAALKKTGRPVWLELSNSLSFAHVSEWAATSNGWRIEGDIEAYGTSNLTTWSHVAARFADAPKWAPWAGKGAWNDLDSLEIGNGVSDGLTFEERRTMMTLWAISCSPLLLGSDLTALDSDDLTLLKNSEVIEVDQQGRPATPVSVTSRQQVWRAQNTDGSSTVALFNLDTSPATVSAHWADLGLSGPAAVRDLWTQRNLGSFTGTYSATLAPHACRLFKITPTSNSQLITDGQYTIISRNSGQVLDAMGAAVANATNVIQWPAHSGLNQRWIVTHLGNNIYRIIGAQSGKALEVNNNSVANGGNVDIWTSDNGGNQKWAATTTSNGYVTLKNITSGKLLEVSGGQTTKGANVDQWSDTGALSQQWKFAGAN